MPANSTYGSYGGGTEVMLGKGPGMAVGSFPGEETTYRDAYGRTRFVEMPDGNLAFPSHMEHEATGRPHEQNSVAGAPPLPGSYDRMTAIPKPNYRIEGDGCDLLTPARPFPAREDMLGFGEPVGAETTMQTAAPSGDWDGLDQGKPIQGQKYSSPSQYYS